VQNRGIQPAGDINISASNVLEINGTSSDGKIRSALSSETLFTWSDLRNLSVSRKRNDNLTSVINIRKKTAIVEATHFIRNALGEIELVAFGDTSLSTKQIPDCRGFSR
jgi:hypothetical protein